MRRRTAWYGALLSVTVLLLLTAGCSEERKAWNEVKSVGTVEAYEAFLEEHPESPFRDRCVDALREIHWEAAKEDGTMAALQQYLADYPEAPNLSEAQEAYDAVMAEDEMASLKEHIKNFLNGDAEKNIIAVLDGMKFSARDQNQSSGGVTFFGTSAMRVAGEITFSTSGRSLGLVYEPTPNRMIAKIEEMTPPAGMDVEFVSGRRYVYGDEGWVLQ